MAVLGVIAACSSDNDTPAGSSSGNGADGGSVGVGDGSTNSSSTSSTSSSSGSSGDDDDAGDAGDAGGGNSIVLSATATGLPGTPILARYNEVTNELWLTTNANDAGLVTSLLVLDPTSLAVKRTVASSSHGFYPIAIASDTNSVYTVTGSEVDVIDGANGTVTKVCSLQAADDTSTSMAYDSALHRLYVAVSSGSGSYLLQIDTTSNTLTKTYPSPATINGFGTVGVSAGNTSLFLVTSDSNFYPMTATFDTVAGTLANLLGGQAATWETVSGPAVYGLGDGGAVGIAGVGLRDGGTMLELLDPGFTVLPGDTLQGVYKLDHPFVLPQDGVGGLLAAAEFDLAVVVMDGCGKPVIRFYSSQLGLTANWADIPERNEVVTGHLKVTQLVELDPNDNSTKIHHFAQVLQPDGTDTGATAVLDMITVTLADPSTVNTLCP